jgi:O-antigen ligase
LNTDHLSRSFQPLYIFAIMDASHEKRRFKIKWGRLTFPTYCIAFLFMALFSVSAVQEWTVPWNHISIFIACLFPSFLLILSKTQERLKIFLLSPEFLFIIAILILGALNIILSNNRNMSLNGMGLFLMSGIFSFISTRLLCDSPEKQSLLLGFFAIIFIFVCLFGFYEFFKGSRIDLFSGNPIPAGSLIILLSIGPMIQTERSQKKLEFYLWLGSLFAGITLLIWTGKKGPIVAVLFMAIFLAVFFLKILTKRFFVSLAIIMSAGCLALIGRFNDFQKMLEGKKWIYSIYFRLENYLYGFHIFKKNPLMGTGFPSQITNYHQDYQIHFSEKLHVDAYTQFIEKINALENMALTMLVEMGGLMSATYIMLVLFCCLRLIKAIKKTPHRRCDLGFIMAGLIGFLIHSMTYDSLRFPNLNYIFHSILGMMLGVANTYSQATKSSNSLSKP